MMKRQFVLFVACGVLATALACGDKSSSPAAPSPAGGTGSDVGATADGSTLKVTAPTLVAPANGSTLADSNVALTVSASAGKFTTVSPLAYRFQILLNGQVVKEFRTSTSLKWPLPDLESNTTYSWRARAEQGPFFGPWAAEWTFKTAEQPDGYIRGGEVYDPLVDGKSVGILHGPVTFIPGRGAKMENWSAFIEYHLQQTVTGGEFSMLITNLAANTEGDKTKIMSMCDGPCLNNGDQHTNITSNDRRFTIEKRGNPAGVVAWRVITSNDQIETSGKAQRMKRDFSTSKTYLWKATWGGGRFNLSIREGGASGKEIYSFGKGYRGVYDPSPHLAFVGGPTGRAGSDSGTVNDIIVRQVWLSSRPRPGFANK
jgi:hypothetical protein